MAGSNPDDFRSSGRVSLLFGALAIVPMLLQALMGTWDDDAALEVHSLVRCSEFLWNG